MHDSAAEHEKKYYLQKAGNSAIIFSMEALKEETRQSIEPQFLAQAMTNGAKVRVSQMNKTEHEGIIRDTGRYEINLDVDGTIVTLLKQEISSITVAQPLIPSTPVQPKTNAADQHTSSSARPNIQQEFLDKAIKEHQFLTIYLINGVRVKAHLEGYDSFTLLLNDGGKQHLFYKHAITTINR
jgi:host factor-I protein